MHGCRRSRDGARGNDPLGAERAIEHPRLRARFREVDVTLSAQKTLPERCPASWHAPAITGHSLHYIDSAYRGREATQHELATLFGAVQFETAAMSLREISKVLIRAARGTRASAQAREAPGMGRAA